MAPDQLVAASFQLEIVIVEFAVEVLDDELRLVVSRIGNQETEVGPEKERKIFRESRAVGRFETEIVSVHEVEALSILDQRVDESVDIPDTGVSRDVPRWTVEQGVFEGRLIQR